MSIISYAEKIYRTSAPSRESREIHAGLVHCGSLYLLIFRRRPDICICSVLPAIGGYCTTSKHYRPGRPFSSSHWSFSVSLTLLVATSGWRARPGSIKTPAEFCVEANENALKVNDPQGLNSPPWSHPPTLLVQWPWFTHCLSALTHLHLSSGLPHFPICNSRNFNLTKPANSELASRLVLPLLALGILR